ncbi:unnamed protein product [Closterium sp. NIES-64]|nr:unnamed protein product [Closterium sp. NIES-64]
MWTSNCITTLTPPSARRLSLRHGASAADIKAYMRDLFHELETTRLAGIPLSADGWRRRTAGAPRLQDCYKIGRDLGRGHFGVVRECADARTGERFACKTILKDQIQRPEDLKELRAEVLVPLLLQAEAEPAAAARKRESGQQAPKAAGFVRLFEVAEDESALHLIVEHCAGGDLFDHVARNKRLAERETAGIFRQVVSAVLRMHATFPSCPALSCRAPSSSSTSHSLSSSYASATPCASGAEL